MEKRRHKLTSWFYYGKTIPTGVIYENLTTSAHYHNQISSKQIWNVYYLQGSMHLAVNARQMNLAFVKLTVL